MTSSDTGPDPVPDAGVWVLGVRHHGPGSARSVAAALAELRPQVVVIEGAPELDGLLEWAGHPDLVPPVAGLVYAVDSPRRAAFYPLAEFSPEWVAMRWALAHRAEVRFADLPAVHALAPAPPDEPVEPDEPDGAGPDVGTEAESAPDQPLVDPTRHRPDPIAALAEAAGYDDAERWWEDAVEHRAESSLERFDAVRDAMAAVREGLPLDGPGREDPEILRREAAMRRVLRALLKEDPDRRIAVVCGAYHAPVLHPDAFPPAAHDNRLLTGLPRTKVAVTWAPWTANRLAQASGYGAGVTAPGWYRHLFRSWTQGADGEEIVAGWLTRVARALRAEELDASPASVVESARFATALATVRGRPSVGLAELDDAVETVLCEGSALPLQLVHRTVVVGEELGTVPDGVPLTPLAQDLAREQRRLRLKPTARPTALTLDLRKDGGRDRSVLLHRLRLLDVGWGRPGGDSPGGRSTGTFREEWSLEWEPELAVALIEAGLYGTTVLDAAESRAVALAAEAPDLAALGTLVERCLTAELPRGLAGVVDELAARTARQHDVVALLEAVEPLARTRRYGDVRGADTSRVAGVVETVVTRAAVGLRAACATLDDDAAARMRVAVEAADRGVALLDDAALTDPWTSALRATAADERVHGLVAGRANRLLLDAGHLDSAEAGRRLSRRLSRQISLAADPGDAAGWLDGFLEGDALLLLHDPTLLAIVDAWVAGIDETTFDDVLPLLRRTFSRFEAAERRRIGTRLRQPGATGTGHRTGSPDADGTWDLARGLPAALRVRDLLRSPAGAGR